MQLQMRFSDLLVLTSALYLLVLMRTIARLYIVFVKPDLTSNDVIKTFFNNEGNYNTVFPKKF